MRGHRTPLSNGVRRESRFKTSPGLDPHEGRVVGRCVEEGVIRPGK